MTKVENAKNTPATRALPRTAVRVKPKIVGLIVRLRSGIPATGRGDLAGVVAEVARRAAERPLDAVGEALVAAVEDLGEQVAHKPRLVGAQPRVREPGREVLHG